MIYRYIALIIFIILYGCTSEEQRISSSVHLRLSKIEDIDVPYRIEKLIPLETNESNWLGVFLKVRFHGDYIYVLDNDSRDGIYQFDKNGRYVSALAQVGDGPRNIPNIYDYTPFENGIVVLSGNGDHSVLYFFNNSNEVLNKVKLPLIADSFDLLPSGNFILYAGYNSSIFKYRLYETDINGKILNTYLPNSHSNNMIPVMESNFYKSNESVYFRESFNSKTFKFKSNHGLYESYEFDFGNSALPSKFWDLDFMEGFELINKSGFSNIYSYMESDKYSFFEIYLQKNNSVNNVHVIYDKMNKKAVKIAFNKNEGSIFYHPVRLSEQSDIYFISHPKYLKGTLDKLNFNAEDLHIINKLKEDDNPVLIYARLEN